MHCYMKAHHSLQGTEVQRYRGLVLERGDIIKLSLLVTNSSLKTVCKCAHAKETVRVHTLSNTLKTFPMLYKVE